MIHFWKSDLMSLWHFSIAFLNILFYFILFLSTPRDKIRNLWQASLKTFTDFKKWTVGRMPLSLSVIPWNVVNSVSGELSSYLEIGMLFPFQTADKDIHS